jgi:putative endonuclease
MNANEELGRLGENAAAAYLRRLGWTIIDRNWRCPEGELDIVAYDGRRHVVCEVKTRRTTAYGAPLEAITPAKAARLRRLAGRWASDHRVRGSDVRVDVLGLIPCPEPSVPTPSSGVSWVMGGDKKRPPGAAESNMGGSRLPGTRYAESCGFSVEHVRGVC